MSVAHRIRSCIEGEISSGQPVEIYQVAEQIRAEYPQFNLEEIARLVTETVIAAGGNAHWDPQKQQA